MRTKFYRPRDEAKRPFMMLGFSLLLVALCLPLTQMAFHPFSDLKSEENRILAARPVFNKTAGIHDFIRRFEAYFDDNFGFRNVLIRMNTLIHLKIFRISPTPLNEVVVGKSGWLFYNVKNDGSSFQDYYGLDALDSRQLAAIKHNLQAMKERLAKLKIALVFVVSPSKHSIYEEYLPSGVVSMKGSPHRVDQIMKVWGKDDQSACLIDLRPILLIEKKEWPYPLYLKTDTHWNNLGSFIAYREIIKKAKHFHDRVHILSPGDFRIHEERVSSEGDLCRMINVDCTDESDVILEPLSPSKIKVLQVQTDHYRQGWRSTAEGVKPVKALLFGDSFSERLIPFLGESFSEGAYFISPPMVDFTIIEKEMPDVLVIELTERYAGSLKIRWSSRQTKPERWVFFAPAQ
jgi:alginate O-acetyltransferase complex protein AlgJ